MSVNIRNLVNGYYSPSVIANYSAKLTESEHSVTKALNSFTAATMQALYIKGKNIPGLFFTTKKLYRNAILSGLSSSGSVPNANVTKIVQELFGDRKKQILNSIAQSAKIKEASALPLFHLATNIIFGCLGKYFQENQGTDAWLFDLFQDQRVWAQKLLPSDLSWEDLSLGKDFENETRSLPVETAERIKRINYQTA